MDAECGANCTKTGDDSCSDQSDDDGIFYRGRAGVVPAQKRQQLREIFDHTSHGGRPSRSITAGRQTHGSPALMERISGR